MDLFALVVSCLAFIVAMFGKNFLPSYLGEKGKNLASKEDLDKITNIVETVKSKHQQDLERLRSELNLNSAAIEERRRVYHEICTGLRVFIEGNPKGLETKEKFLSAYATAWIWAPDTVLMALNSYLQLQINYARNPANLTQQELKEAYAKVILEMRKDVGFKDTSLSESNYQFVYFGATGFGAIR